MFLYSDSCFFDDGDEFNEIEYHKSSISNLQFRLVRVGLEFTLWDVTYFKVQLKLNCGAQAPTPRVALLPFVKSTEYLVNPVSSIQYPESWPITSAAFMSK